MKGNSVQFYLSKNLWSPFNNFEDYNKWKRVYNIVSEKRKYKIMNTSRL